MIKINCGLILLVIFVLAFPAYSDVPPESGMSRVSINLVTETADDLSDYRFFIDFYGDLREIEIKSNGRTEIPPMGGGARYSSGTFLAVPLKSLAGYEERSSGQRLEELSRALKNKEIAGVVELAVHRFVMDVPKGGEPPAAFYVIKRAENSIMAERIAAEPAAFDVSAVNYRAGYLVGGILLSLAVILAGIFAFRKVAKKV